MAIIRGTTPTITFTFSEVDVDDIIKAIMTISQFGKIIIEKDLSTAVVNETSISWKLKQEETLKLRANADSEITCDWLLGDETRGRSYIRKENVERTGVNEVI